MSQWILLRGLAREARHWGDFPALLKIAIADTQGAKGTEGAQGAQGAPVAEVTAPDLPGNGQLFRMKSPARIEVMVEHLRADLRQRQVAPPYHLLALSLGGMVAVAWAQTYPEEIAALVLINTSLRPLNPWYWRLRSGSYSRLLQIVRAGANAPLRERLILDLTCNFASENSAVLPQWIAWRNECPVSTGNALRQIAAAMLYSAPTSTPQPPALMLASDGDRLVDVRCTVQLAERWATKLALHPSAGHDLPLDAGPWVVAQVREWLQERSLQGA
jgi:pimeloyl-ACP methyl ester carboxylesterase